MDHNCAMSSASKPPMPGPAVTDWFDDLLTRIDASISYQDTNCRHSISAEERLSICLRCGDCYLAREEFMAVPGAEDWRSIAKEFGEQWSFPLCCGALDGKHARVVVISQWRMFRRELEIHPEGAENCVKATCVLHNFMRASADGHVPALRRAGEHEEPLPGVRRMGANNSARDATSPREAFMAYLCEEGALPWQPMKYSCPPQD
ncbi:hypothetical protein CRENBAI_000628 [Crenichthys baileyi]|uniref:DDE Tnp4 domain-containing protein n=1 Tax=Crenichthys baileyi TaxID=28760 RepID=A0AAV9S074_9TELE